MKLRRIGSSSILIGAIVCASGPDLAAAQNDAFNFELTPVAGFRAGGHFKESDGRGRFDLRDSDAQGLIFNMAARADVQWEVLYALQNTEVSTRSLLSGDGTTDLDVEYLHFGGAVLFGNEATRPFLAFTAGLSRFDPRPEGLGAENYLSVSLGGGVKLRGDKRVGVRIEGRVYTTLVDKGSKIFCRSLGGSSLCAIEIDGTTLTQAEVRLGLVVRF